MGSCTPAGCSILSPNPHPHGWGPPSIQPRGGVAGCWVCTEPLRGFSSSCHHPKFFLKLLVCSSSPPSLPPTQTQLAFLLSRTLKFLSWRCFKPLHKAWKITGSTMVVML